MNAQQIFDRTLNHLRTQGSQAGENGNCCFLADDGKRCAVGCHLPMDLLKLLRDLNLNDVSTLKLESLNHLPDELKPHLSLLRDLQLIHDDAENWDHGQGFNTNGESALKTVAKEYGLTYTPR